MRFVVMVKATKDSEAGKMPSTKLLEEMGKFNEELVKAGIMLAGEGLHPSSKAVRVRFNGDTRTVIDGPFAETKELVAGFWIWQVKSREEAIEWALRCPTGLGFDDVLEIRALTGEADVPPNLLELTRRAAPAWSASIGLSRELSSQSSLIDSRMPWSRAL